MRGMQLFLFLRLSPRSFFIILLLNGFTRLFSAIWSCILSSSWFWRLWTDSRLRPNTRLRTDSRLRPNTGLRTHSNWLCRALRSLNWLLCHSNLLRWTCFSSLSLRLLTSGFLLRYWYFGQIAIVWRGSGLSGCLRLSTLTWTDRFASNDRNLTVVSVRVARLDVCKTCFNVAFLASVRWISLAQTYVLSLRVDLTSVLDEHRLFCGFIFRLVGVV